MSITGGKFSVYVGLNMVQVSLVNARGVGCVRGAVSGISRKSKARMNRFLNSVSFVSAQFLTLTFHRNEKSQDEAYKCLRAFHKRIVARWGGICLVWRRETQKRGAYHFHCFLLDADIPKGWYRDAWSECAGEGASLAHRRYGTHCVDLGRLGSEDAGVIVAYMAKYAGKDGDSVGRAWGVLGRAHARVVAVSGALGMGDAEVLVSDMMGRGGVALQDDTGLVKVWRLYFGRMGEGNPELVADIVSRLAKPVVE